MLAPVKNRLLNILLADDGSLDVHAAVQLLADLPHESECVITALRVFTPLESSEYHLVEAEALKTTKLLDSRHFQFKSELILGYPSDTIIAYAEEHTPDLIVMGAKGKNLFDGLLGSVVTDVVHSGKWPVLIVRPSLHEMKRILLVTDGSPASQSTCDYLGAFPLPALYSLEVMHVLPAIKVTYLVEPAGMLLPMYTAEDEARLTQENKTIGHEILEKACYQLGQHGLDAKKVMRTGDPVEQILEYAHSNQIDMLVCGSQGMGNITGWLLGSISRELVLRAPCSVLVVRKPQ